MMKCTLFLVALTAFFSRGIASTPTADEALFWLFSNYQVEDLQPDYFLLAKTREGYAYYTADYSKYPEETSDLHLFYSFKSQSYIQPDLVKRAEPVASREALAALDPYLDINRKLSFGNRYGFERCPYYGYGQWSWDVIQDYGNRDNLSNVELEGLSRAYLSYAQGYLWGQSTQYLANASWPHRNFKSGDDIPESNIDSFLLYSSLEMATIEKLIARDPMYHVIVGTISNKLANEYMDVALQLAQYGRNEQAMQYARRARYDTFMLTAAANYLQACKGPSLLFTNGDNDSYPVWYLQMVRGVRRDVVVLNLSLLPLTRYARMYTSGNSPFGYAKAVAFMNSSQTLGNFGVEVGNTNCSQYKSADSLIQYYYRHQSDGLNTDAYPCSNILVHTQQDSAYFKINSYFHSGDIFMLDVIQSNPLTVNYTLNGFEESKQWSNSHAIGNTVQIANHGSETSEAMIANYYLNEFRTFPKMSGYHIDRDYSIQLFCEHAISELGQAILWSSQQGFSSQTKQLTQMAMEIFPDGNLHPCAYWGWLADVLLRTGNSTDAQKLCDYLMMYARDVEAASLAYQNAHPNQIPALNTQILAGRQLAEILKSDIIGEYPKIKRKLKKFMDKYPY